MGKGLSANHIIFRRTGHDGVPCTVLNDISLHVDHGQAVLIHGPTGVGKTTLLHLLASLMRPTQGEITADEGPVSRWTVNHRDLWRRNVGIVFQQPYLLSRLTVLENVCVPLVPRDVELKAMRQMGLTRLSEMGVGELAGANPMALSGGECQRVAVARALVSRPTYLLMDEPTAFQDDSGVELIVKAIKSARDKGAAAIICSHDPRLYNTKLFDAAYHLAGGRLTGRILCTGIGETIQ